MTKHSSFVHFGTSGHRGIIGESFTLAHVEAVGHGVADFLFQSHSHPRLIIGYDPRHGNDISRKEGSFTAALVETLLSRGVTVYFCETVVPTPVISWAICHEGLDGGLILTASHNPSEYNGIKFNPSNGAPAPEDVTRFIEAQANLYLQDKKKPLLAAAGGLIMYQPIPMFARSLVATLKSVLNITSFSSFPSFAIDAKYGTSAAVWQALFYELGSKGDILHSEPRSDFGGIVTNPTDIAGLHALKNCNAELSIAHDPDADRHQLLDDLVTPVSPEETSVILAEWLISRGVPFSGFVTTLASSGLVRDAARKHGVSYKETQVGFKYIAPYLEEASRKNEVVFGVESSGGFSTSFHTFEKCGFLPAVMVLVMFSELKVPFSEIRKKLKEDYGDYFFVEKSFDFLAEKRSFLVDYFKSSTVDSLEPIFSEKIVGLDQRDGLKVIFESGAWVLVRLSGTEPVMRVYAESKDRNYSEKLTYLINERISG